MPKAAAYTMQGKSKFFAPQSFGVGPQTYSPNITTKQPSYSFSYKNDINNEKLNYPGVGQYMIDQTVPEIIQERDKNIINQIDKKKKKKKIQKGCSFAQSKRPQSSDQTPGPSSYNTTFYAHQQRGSYAYSMTRSQRLVSKEKEQMSSPDPRTYYPKSTHTRWPAWKMGARTSTPVQDLNTPGPGTYNQEFKFCRTTSIGHSKRQSFSASHYPGPGSYDLQQSFFLKQSFRKKDKYDFRKKSKGSLQRIELIPGPSEYRINDSFVGKGIKYSIRAKHEKMFQQDNVPGPGHYDIEFKNKDKDHQDINLNDTMTRAQRVDLSLQNRTGPTVGPGSYMIDDNLTKIQKFKHPVQPFKVRSTMQNPEKLQFSPGPGSYNLGYTIGFIPNYMEKGLIKKEEKKILEFRKKALPS